MKQKSVSRKGTRILKSFLYSMVILILLIAIFGLLIRFTPLPERYMNLYMLFSLSIASLVLGIFSGNIHERKGAFYGMIYSVLLLFLIMIVSILITGTPSDHGFLQPRYLACLICGGLGGMIGVNLRS